MEMTDCESFLEQEQKHLKYLKNMPLVQGKLGLRQLRVIALHQELVSVLTKLVAFEKKWRSR